MRIRKNAAKILCPLTIAAQSFALAEEGDEEGGAEKSVCVLNQSPWDAMSFTPPRRSTAPPFPEEAEVEDDAVAAAAAAAATGAVTETSLREELIGDEPYASAVRDSSSISATQLTFRRRVKIEAVIDESEVEIEKEKTSKKRRGRKKKTKKKKPGEEEANGVVGKPETDPSVSPSLICKKTDGKGWFCKREAHYPHSLCEYHLIQVRSYYSGGVAADHPRACQSSGEQYPGNKRPERKKTSKNIGGGDKKSDFYYYSGFGPWWGKRRNKAKGDEEEVRFDNRAAEDVGIVEDGKMDGGEALLADDDGVDDSGKRRGRKPIKARSLKSLL